MGRPGDQGQLGSHHQVSGRLIALALLVGAIVTVTACRSKRAEISRDPARPDVSTRASSLPSPELDPSGPWRVNAAGYGGTLVFDRRGDAFDLHWAIPAEYVGVGLIRNGHLYAGWTSGPTVVGAHCGVVVYRIGTDGALHGIVTTATAKGATAHEEASGGKPGVLEGSYDVRGDTPGGGPGYSGTLVITHHDEVYTLEWIVGTSHTRGAGLRNDDTLGASWGPSAADGISEWTLSPVVMNGRWATPGSKAVEEDLSRR